MNLHAIISAQVKANAKAPDATRISMMLDVRERTLAASVTRPDGSTKESSTTVNRIMVAALTQQITELRRVERVAMEYDETRRVVEVTAFGTDKSGNPGRVSGATNY